MKKKKFPDGDRSGRLRLETNIFLPFQARLGRDVVRKGNINIKQRINVSESHFDKKKGTKTKKRVRKTHAQIKKSVFARRPSDSAPGEERYFIDFMLIGRSSKKIFQSVTELSEGIRMAGSLCTFLFRRSSPLSAVLLRKSDNRTS